MSAIFHGGNTYIFYNEATDNTQPNNVAYKNIDQLGAFPQVKITSSNTTLETYNDEWTSVLSGNMTIDSVSIVVHYIADNDSHLYLDAAYANGTNFQIKVALYESQDSLEQHYVMLNGYISGYQDSADQNAVYDRTYTFTAEDLVARGTATDPATLHVGDYGVGSDGETTPHYEAQNPTGNSFIKVSALREDNLIDVDMGGIAFVDNGGDKNAQLVITTENGLRIFAKNTDTAWTEFKSATQNGLTYVPLTRTVNGKALSSNITLSASDVSALPITGGTLTGAITGTGATFTGTVQANSLTLTNALPVAQGGTGSKLTDGTGAVNIGAVPMRGTPPAAVTDINQMGVSNADKTYLGVWNFSGSAQYNLVNVPDPAAGMLEVYTSGAFVCIQRYTTRYGTIYTRSCTATWSAASPNVFGPWTSAGNTIAATFFTGDLNNLITPGQWSVTTGATNIPVSIVGRILVESRTPTPTSTFGDVTQTYSTFSTASGNANRVFKRSYSASGASWSDWVEYYSSGSSIITTREFNTTYRQTMSRSDAFPPYTIMNRLDQVDGTLPSAITTVGYIQADLTDTSGTPYGRALGNIAFQYNTTGGGITSIHARNAANSVTSQLLLNGDLGTAYFTGIVERAGGGTLSFNANRNNSASNSYYGAQTTAGQIFFGTGSGTNFVVNNQQSNSSAWLSMDGTNASFLTKVSVPTVATSSITGLSGTLTLGADAVTAYDAVTLRQLQAATGTGTATINGVMNSFLGAVEWFLGTRAAMPGGHLAADGQLLSRTTYADLWAAISSGVLKSVSEANWQASAANRGMYSTGDGSTTFRMPDLNGAQSGSIISTFLRGNAGTTAATTLHGDTGTVSSSAAPNITGTATTDLNGKAWLSFSTVSGSIYTDDAHTSTGTFIPNASTYTTTGTQDDRLRFDASLSSSVYGTSTEVRPSSVVGIWLIRVNGLFSAANTNFNVINSDTITPTSGTIVYGGDVRSAYRIAGADTAVARLRSRYVVGGEKYVSLSLDGYSGSEVLISSGGSLTVPSAIRASAFRALGSTMGVSDATETNLFDFSMSGANMQLARSGSGSFVLNGIPMTGLGTLSWSSTATLYATLSSMGIVSTGTNQYKMMTNTGRQLHIQTNSAVVTLNTSGETTIAYPSTFATACMICIPVMGDSTGGTSVRIINYNTTRTANFDVHVEGQAGSACRINFIAIGY